MTKIKPTELHCFAVEHPPKGCKFVAFYNDGSGAGLFYRNDEGDYMEGYDGLFLDDGELEDIGYLFWAKLPDDFKLWYEVREGLRDE